MAMFKPTYQEIIDKINEENGEVTVTSRYPIVLAAAKRARQLVDGARPLVANTDEKPLSIAVEELIEGDVLVNHKEDDVSSDWIYDSAYDMEDGFADDLTQDKSDAAGDDLTEDKSDVAGDEITEDIVD